jgi:glycosyltransferase involved in cell wall biosynthesis
MPAVAAPRVSVVVPVLDMADTIGACLDALIGQSLAPNAREIIVVDNGSSDGTRDVVARYPVTLLEERAPGAASARNRGLAAARGQLIAFTDADCVASRGWLAHLVRSADASAADVVAGPMAVLDPEASLVSRYSAALGQYDPARTLAHPVFPYAGTANICVRRAVFDDIGPFNPAFPTFDAAELFWRLSQRGPLRAFVERRAVVFYRTRATIGAFVRQNYGYGLGAARLWRLAGRHGDVQPSARAALRTWRRRLADGGQVAQSAAAGTSALRTLPLFALHVLRESAIAAGFVAASLESRA